LARDDLRLCQSCLDVILGLQVDGVLEIRTLGECAASSVLLPLVGPKGSVTAVVGGPHLVQLGDQVGDSGTVVLGSSTVLRVGSVRVLGPQSVDGEVGGSDLGIPLEDNHVEVEISHHCCFLGIQFYTLVAVNGRGLGASERPHLQPFHT